MQRIQTTCHLGVAALAVLIAGACPHVLRAADAPALQFNRDVRPIFSDTCFRCHGFDRNARKGDLRLDVPEDAFAKHKKGTPIVPGKPELSEAYERMMSSDPEKAMPPPNSKLTLNDAQKLTIRRWIEQGASYQKHWAFIPVTRPPLPEAPASATRNSIDAFILERLKREGLGFSPEADRERLIRRVSFDLTGLPPTPAEIKAFVEDKSPDAYRKVVDRLLASPRYGERMASDWLDLARYADTHGYQMDRYRPMWPYRDWVIKAFNQNLPFDVFSTWQLAGDLLPNATKEQRLATAFCRLHMQNEEGGIVEEEFRVAYVDDRVDTLGTTFLGLTVNCAHCHDHKFDPVTQKDFYSLFALFQNVDEAGQTAYFNNNMPVPTLLLSSDAQDAQLATLNKQIADQEQALARLRASLATADVSSPPGTPATQFASDGLVGDWRFDKLDGDKLQNLADAKTPGIASDKPALVDDGGPAVRLDGDNGFHFPGVGAFSRIDPFSLSIWLKAATVESPRQVVLHHSQAPADAGSRGYELLLENGHLSFGLHHMWPGSSIKLTANDAIQARRWTHVVVTYDGSSHAAGVHLYVDGAAAPCAVIKDNLVKDIVYNDGGSAELTIGYRFRDAGFKGGSVRDFKVYSRELSSVEAAGLAGVAGGDPTDHLLAHGSPEAAAIRAKLLELRRQQRDLIEPIPEIMVMQEMAAPRKAYVLKRGQYDMHGEEVCGDVPAFLPPLAADEPHNRLGLAHWLFRKDHPLTARVEVNRLWQQMFGKGLVETAENFGSQGSYPTHPELLDWLAAEFMESHWDVKHMLRLMATSAAYRQSSRATEDLLSRDPANQLLARGPAHRLTAEMLRDQALYDSGLLVERIGGASVKPYQPDGLWDVAMGGPHYDQGHGDELHRRTLYTYWKRTVPPPALVTFDAADRSYCTARRQSTSTPLQALALLDDVQITEAAKFVSQRVLKEGGNDPDARLRFVFGLLCGRQPTDTQLATLRRLYAEQHAIFAADPASADKLLQSGEAKLDLSLDRIDLATGAVLAEALFNYDETMMRR